MLNAEAARPKGSLSSSSTFNLQRFNFQMADGRTAESRECFGPPNLRARRLRSPWQRLANAGIAADLERQEQTILGRLAADQSVENRIKPNVAKAIVMKEMAQKNGPIKPTAAISLVFSGL